MFGYIKPFKPELKIKEFDTFKAIYCGNCKQLKKSYGPFSTLTLSYDFTFITAISLALNKEEDRFAPKKCAVNPLKKKMCLCSDSKQLDYCTGCAILMVYYKIKDDIQDEKFFKKIKALLALPFVFTAREKAKKLFPNADKVIAEAIKRQRIVEKSDNISIDRAADPSSEALGKICMELSNDEKQKNVLYRFGYLLGRYVYFADALDDLEEDKKKNTFNPFLLKFKDSGKTIDEIKAYAVEVINLTVGDIPSAYELLNLYKYKEILDNIIYLGLQHEIKHILAKKEHKNEQPI